MYVEAPSLTDLQEELDSYRDRKAKAVWSHISGLDTKWVNSGARMHATGPRRHRLVIFSRQERRGLVVMHAHCAGPRARTCGVLRTPLLGRNTQPLKMKQFHCIPVAPAKLSLRW
ncbi:hypothetical protein IG631_07370 [Alternaria alternata]|nr:hypothetical protein IG631_07370 [Alternaria alternata]